MLLTNTGCGLSVVSLLLGT